MSVYLLGAWLLLSLTSLPLLAPKHPASQPTMATPSTPRAPSKARLKGATTSATRPTTRSATTQQATPPRLPPTTQQATPEKLGPPTTGSVSAQRLSPQESRSLRHALSLLAQGQLQGAALLARRWQGPQEDRPEVLYFLGLLDLLQARYKQAERRFRRVMERRPAAHRVRLDLARAMLGRKNYAWAIRLLQPLPSRLPRQAGVVRYYLGYALLKLGELTDAEEMLRLALKGPGIGPLRERCQLAPR